MGPRVRTMRVPTGDLLVRSHRRRRAAIDGERKVKIKGRRQNGLKLRAGVLRLNVHPDLDSPQLCRIGYSLFPCLYMIELHSSEKCFFGSSNVDLSRMRRARAHVREGLLSRAGRATGPGGAAPPPAGVLEDPHQRPFAPPLRLPPQPRPPSALARRAAARQFGAAAGSHARIPPFSGEWGTVRVAVGVRGRSGD